MGYYEFVEARPIDVRRGIKLLWLAWLGGIVFRWLLFGVISMFSGVSVMLPVLSGPVIDAFLIFKISSGRKWARGTYLALCIWSGVVRLGIVATFIGVFPKIMLGVAALVAIEAWGLVLLFSSDSREWFQAEA
jgi:hypothetical protein